MSFEAVFYQQSRSTVCGHLTASWCTLCQVQQTADEEDDSRHGEHGPADRCAGVARCAGARACRCTRLHDGACSCESQRHAGAVSSQIIRCVPALTLILTVLSISMFISTKHHIVPSVVHVLQKPISRSWLAAGQRFANYYSPDGFYGPMNLNRSAINNVLTVLCLHP